MEQDLCYWLHILPSELQPLPLTYLDLANLDRCQSVCRKLREFVLASGNWQRTYEKYWPTDIMSTFERPRAALMFRHLCLTKPYPRFDGIYIGTCRYIRNIQPGASLTDHRTALIVEYFRVIRLIPDGTGQILRCESLFEPNVIKMGHRSLLTQGAKSVKEQS
jgi:hypothetical protein